MKKLILSAMLGLLVVATAAPMSASAKTWGCSLNPGGMYRQNEANNYSYDTTSSDYEAGDETVTLESGPDAIYARVKNSEGSWRSGATYIENDGSYNPLDNSTMSPGHDYYLWCKNAVSTASWVWASGDYEWN